MKTLGTESLKTQLAFEEYKQELRDSENENARKTQSGIDGSNELMQQVDQLTE